MKRLTCEMCGSTDLIKKDGVFECQSCGCKYSVEEAKKMMVEGTVEVHGTVKIDSSEELKNLYELARRAKKDRNWDNAAKYYEMITIKDPSNWEAAFYSVFSKATTCTIGDIHIAGNSIYNCVQSTIELINNTISDKSVQIQAYTEVTNQVVEIIKALNNLARKQFDKYTPQMKEIFKEKFFTNISPTVCTMYELGDKLDLFFGSDIEANKLSVIAWKQGIEFERSLIPYLNDSKFIRKNINEYEKKIIKYDGMAGKEKAKITKLKQRHQQLLGIKRNWNKIESNINSYNNEIQNLQMKVSRLNKEKLNLGFFEGKKKKEIATAVASSEEKIQYLNQKIFKEKTKKCGFLSLESLVDEISRTEAKIKKLNDIIDENSTEVDSCKN